MQVTRPAECRHDQYTYLGETGANCFSCRNAVHMRHFDVDNCDINGRDWACGTRWYCVERSVLPCQAGEFLKNLHPIGGLCNYLNVMLQVEQPRQSSANHRLIVGHEHTNCHATSSVDIWATRLAQLGALFLALVERIWKRALFVEWCRGKSEGNRPGVSRCAPGQTALVTNELG